MYDAVCGCLLGHGDKNVRKQNASQGLCNDSFTNDQIRQSGEHAKAAQETKPTPHNLTLYRA